MKVTLLVIKHTMLKDTPFLLFYKNLYGPFTSYGCWCFGNYRLCNRRKMDWCGIGVLVTLGTVWYFLKDRVVRYESGSDYMEWAPLSR